MGLLLVLPGDKAEQEAQEFRAGRVKQALLTFLTDGSIPLKFYAYV